MSNSLDPDQARQFVWVQTVYKVYPQTIQVEIKKLMKMYVIPVCKHSKPKDHPVDARLIFIATCVSTCKFYVGLETKQGGRLSSQNKATKNSSKHGRDKTKRQWAVSD